MLPFDIHKKCVVECECSPSWCHAEIRTMTGVPNGVKRLVSAVQTYHWGEPAQSSLVARLKQANEPDRVLDSKLLYAEVCAHSEAQNYQRQNTAIHLLIEM